MLRLFPAAVDRRSVPDGEEISLSSVREDDIHQFTEEDSVSGESSEDEGDSSSVSDCESVTSAKRSIEHTRIQADGLVRLDESDKLHGIIGKKFISRLSVHGVNAQVQYIHRNLFNAGSISLARLRSFQIFTKAVEKKNGGDANIKYGWFGASKDEIKKIILHGFGHDNIKNSGLFGHAVVLSADHSPLESMESASLDDDGIRHILLCRVILGKTELVNPFSTQCHPSSEDFQSGVDNLASPKKFVVWSSQMNTHILPEFVISFKTLSTINRPQLDGVHLRKPVSPWIPIPDLIAALSKLLPPESMKEITKYRRSYIEHKISRRDMIQGIREFTGDRLLLMVLKDFTEQRRHGLGGKFESRSDLFK
ncbi:probable inactive poly [ADP-ribose] polymerase SRO5 isoform X2 [Cynara cardunculus var. scolymus]|uniref:Poly(ADP-ribose) polymerase, catalytic domain-containing protein n=1 Tax=Cynara cardunculus var. scolymus TaxID=59895 RepID=A0A118K3R6_CYNCS|nr:probable inactive poly [ADP-ribose] polymerase SRO5 isoform X2 [Cynara cardunculus var. scolymus]KVI06332.1 Poly(ADP-ribose) polymerase, catalytic domain-containing protein [Cynara cardunculus var. scolymus]